ncbi:hypothetical protein ACTXT7_006451 [Hymenolepis weldensis]
MLKYALLCLTLVFVGLIQISQSANKVIFISFDGFRYDYLDMAEKKGRNISAFKALREQGFQADVENVFVTLTFPSHYAMATGRTVENHGLVGNDFYDPKEELFYHYKDKVNNMESVWFDYGHSEPIWLTNERHGGKSCVFQWVGSETRIRNQMPLATAGVYNDAYSLRFRIDRLLDWISRPEFNLGMLYFSEPDKSGHSYGPDSIEVMNAVELTNEGVSYLLQRIDQIPELKDNVNIIISSDHGMAYTNCDTQTIDLSTIVSDYRLRYTISPATLDIWPKVTTDITPEEILERLKGKEHITAYLKKDIPDRYHYKNNHRIAPVFVVADQGWMIRDSDEPYTNLYGMHGYDNANPEMHPFMVAAGPDLKQFTERQIFYQIDIYPLICALLGLDKPNKIDGLIDRAIPFMKNPPNETFLTQFRKYADGTLTP